MQKNGSTLSFLGLQEAHRKYRSGSMTHGPWAGYMAYTNEGELCVLIAKNKCDKGKGNIRDLVFRTKKSRWLDHKELERGRGFLIYLSGT
jgi:putative hemolysin